jgi:periplasmic protein TonB
VAFDAFRAESQPRPRRGRITAALSIAFHGALLAAGVAYSFWHVDELTPPMVKVTFLSAAPPPPPPPPPAGGGGAARKKMVAKPKTPTKVPDIVQPRETPEERPQETKATTGGPGERGGVKGGVVGGTIGGTVGGTIGGSIGGTKGGVIGGTIGGTGPARKFLPPNMGALQKESGEMPGLPVQLNRAGASYVVSAKICVARTGTVDSVTVMQHADSLLDDNVVRAVKGWRYRPLMADNIAVPFCYFGRFEFTSH